MNGKHVSDLHRLLGELVLLKGRERWTPRSLGKRFDVSEKTIRRDIRKLEATGFGVRFDRRAGAYRLDGGSFLPPVQLTLEEALSLVILCEDIGGKGQIANLDKALGALAKIESQLPLPLQRDLESVMDHVEVRLARAGDGGSDSAIFEQIRRAIAGGVVLRCKYKSVSGDSGGRLFEFEPYALWYGVRAWYAIGKHRRRGEIVSLKLRRFRMAQPSSETFTRPATFSVEDFLGNAWQMIPGDREYDVELVFDAAFGETISDTIWHRTQRLTRHDDGSVTANFRVSGLDEITWWVLSMGRHCRVVRPSELRARVKQEAQAAARVNMPRNARPAKRSSSQAKSKSKTSAS